MPLERCQRVTRKFVHTSYVRTVLYVLPAAAAACTLFTFSLHTFPLREVYAAPIVQHEQPFSCGQFVCVCTEFVLKCIVHCFGTESSVTPHNVLYIVQLRQSSSFSFAAKFVIIRAYVKRVYTYAIVAFCAIETNVYAIRLRMGRQTASIGSVALENCSYFFHSIFLAN